MKTARQLQRLSLDWRSRAKKKQPPSSLQGSSLPHRRSCFSRPGVVMRHLKMIGKPKPWQLLLDHATVCAPTNRSCTILRADLLAFTSRAYCMNLRRICWPASIHLNRNLAFSNWRRSVRRRWEHGATQHSSRLHGQTTTEHKHVQDLNAIHGKPKPLPGNQDINGHFMPLGHPSRSHSSATHHSW